MRIPVRRKQHPVIRTSLAIRVGRLSLPALVGVFVLATLISAAVLTLVVAGTDRTNSGIVTAFRVTTASILQPGTMLQESGQSFGYYAAGFTAGLLGILMPIFLLSAFVFKLFQRNPLVWRRIVSVESRLGKPPVLVVRFYNGSSSTLIGTRIQVIARVRSTGRPGRVTNVILPAADRAEDSRDKDTYWPYSLSGVPFSVRVSLGEGLSPVQSARTGLICLPGLKDPVEKSRVSILAIATGVVAETGGTFYSSHLYQADVDLQEGHYQEIDTDYTQPPRSWDGWHDFDRNCEMYVFGYGSLVSPESVEATLDSPIDREKVNYAVLSGWEREWNVGSDKQSHPERTFLLPDGAEFNGVTAVLGLVRRGDGWKCDGAVFPVTSADLSMLDVRERNYERVDVSTSVTWAGKPDDCVVFTYVPRQESVQRLTDAVQDGKPVVIRRGYLDAVYAAFAEIGKLESFKRLTKEPGFAVQELTTVIDPDLSPYLVRTSMASYLQDYAAITRNDDKE